MILPSLPALKDAVSTAYSWLESSKPFLQPSLLTTTASDAVLAFEDLKVGICLHDIVLADILC